LKKSTAQVNDNARQGHFIDDYLAYLLSQASQAVSNKFRACLAAADVSVIEWRVLSTLSDHPQISVGQLSDIVMCKQPTLSKAIDRMEAKEWVTRTLSRQDRRMIAVSIDAAGMKIVRPLLVKAKEVEESELCGFGNKEIHALKETLRDLVRHCSDKEVLDNGSVDSEPLARNDSNYQSATRERS
jgi:DNA-binding MarR family transcriptional regulator